MKHRIVATAWTLVALICASLAVAVAQSNFARIADEGEFRATVVGHVLKLGGASVLIAADGTVSGTARGKPLAGTWIWRDGYFCRNLEQRADYPSENCQIVEVAGDKARFTANQGSGTVRVWDIE